MTRVAPLSLFLALAACVIAPTTAIAPIEPLRLLEAELLVRPAARGLERPSFVPVMDEDAAGAARLVSIRARFVLVDPETAERILGVQDAALLALVVPRERAERLLGELARERPEFELVNETELVLHAGQEGYVSVTEQRAFVSGFTLRSDGRAALADPEVAVATQGSQLVATGTFDGGGERIELDMRVDHCRLDPDLGGVDVALAGANVRIQEPRGLLRSLSTQATLARDEALWIGGASLAVRGDGRALFVLIEAEAQAAD